ncbi:hypothetical protein GCM10008018_72890 [Paenibacillus marchantiophytorum]|uniref:Uncharacterized protein n=1 Tax=Paenibacillus marchantiophytorum TaxID=1619310 RepID=A0ABQ1FJT9_9BACL|nr:hypothetical protein GCM10008018_72890 [Paenibacillus marchantiophytorum]
MRLKYSDGVRLLNYEIHSSILILFLEIVIIKSILRLEYEVNAIELCLKKILGYNIWQKNKKILLVTLIPTILGMIGAMIVWIFINGNIVNYLVYGSIFIFLIEPFIILTYIRKLERAKISIILKGGNL